MIHLPLPLNFFHYDILTKSSNWYILDVVVSTGVKHM